MYLGMGDRDRDEQKHAIGDILAAVEVLDIASDINEFEDWLQAEHALSTSDELLKGYEFFMETAMRTFLHEVIYSSFPL